MLTGGMFNLKTKTHTKNAGNSSHLHTNKQSFMADQVYLQKKSWYGIRFPVFRKRKYSRHYLERIPRINF